MTPPCWARLRAMGLPDQQAITKSLLENPGSISERVIRARLARPQPEGVPGRHVEGENAASRDAGAGEPDRGSQTGSKVQRATTGGKQGMPICVRLGSARGHRRREPSVHPGVRRIIVDGVSEPQPRVIFRKRARKRGGGLLDVEWVHAVCPPADLLMHSRCLAQHEPAPAIAGNGASFATRFRPSLVEFTTTTSARLSPASARA